MGKKIPRDDVVDHSNEEERPKKKRRSEEAPVDAALSTSATAANDEKLQKRKRKEKKRQKKELRRLELLAESQSQSQSPSNASRASPSTLATSVDQDDATATTEVHADDASSQVYRQHPELSALPQSTVDSYLTEKSINITDPSSTTLRPITSFSYLPAGNDELFKPLKAFPAPTPIQAAAWPYLFNGRDVVGIAETGSGKTLAFGIPCIRHLLAKKGKKLRALIVAPTRELAIQVHKQMLEIGGQLIGKIACIYGGVSKDEQRTALKTAMIVVATPGRLKDLIGEGVVDLHRVEYLVLDEADRMLDKGFEDDIKEIVSSMPSSGNRQTLMFTATWPPSIQELAAKFMGSPVRITIGDSPTSDLRANPRIKQIVEVVDPREKDSRLLQLITTHHRNTGGKDKILVFCLYKKEATRVERFIASKGFRVAGIHGDMNQAQRIASLDAFRSGNTPLLVATDVAARGLDIPAVKMVLNVTYPLTAEDYVHRIGRTGRAGADGLAVTLFTELDKAQSGSLINVLKAAKQPVPDALLKFGTTVKRKQHGDYGAFYKDTSNAKPATKIKFD